MVQFGLVKLTALQMTSTYKTRGIMSEKSPWELYKEKNQDKAEILNTRVVKPWDMVNPNAKKATEVLANERYSICQECPELINLTKQCKKCGCIMKFKTKLEQASCPIGKW